MATIQEQLAHEGFTDQEAEAIFRRAAELQSQAEQLETRLPRAVVDESAAAVGIPREYVEQAIQQLQAERTAQLARRAVRQRRGSAVAIGVAVFLVLAAFFSHRTFNARVADVEATQAQLDNVLQRRHDLIPNLIAILSQEELPVFEELVTTFGKRHGLPVTVENVHWPQALSRLKQEKGTIDLITFDINGARFELVQDNLVEDLSGVKGLLPSLMHPVMLKSLDSHERRFFLPFRPKVRLVFVNRKQLAELSSDRLVTWADVLEVAKQWYERDGEPRVIVEGGEADAPLLLLELIRSAGGDPCNVLHPQSQAAVQLLRELWPYVSPISSRVDWQTASGFLLSESVYVARNWAFALSLLHDAGQARAQEFEVSAGWRWAQDSKPSYLLGGELLALPKQAPHREVALKLLRFLTSKEAQADLVKKLSWPPMRLDVMGALDEWQQRYQAAVTRALHDAEPVPAYWWPAMQPLYARMFATIVALSPQADLEQTLASFQALQKGSCDKTP